MNNKVATAFKVLETESKTTIHSVFIHFVGAVMGVHAGGSADRIDEFIDDYFDLNNLVKVIDEVRRLNET